MPRTKKLVGTAADARNGRRAELAPAGPVEPPAIDRALYQDVTLIMWDAYWADPIASTQTPADLMWAITWLRGLDDYFIKKALADAEPVVEGSMGQPTANPLYAVANASLAAAERAARQLGIGAKFRADLGVAIVSGQQALDDLNARYNQPEEDDDDADDDDPRRARS